MKALILSPHTDDAELGCGGTISKLIEKGYEIYVVIFSTCEKSLPIGFESGTLKKESIDSLTSLNISKDNIIYLDYDVRLFNYRRQDILDDIIKIKLSIEPDMVFIPSVDDYHQDHKTIAEEGIRCFKNNCTILSYELIWNNTGFKNQLYFTLTEKNIEDKIKSLSMYKSQSKRKYTSPEFIRSLAKVRGIQNGVDMAEAFEVIRIKM
jgi:LmbE family N-acetylglucosaminyl deacetylase